MEENAAGKVEREFGDGWGFAQSEGKDYEAGGVGRLRSVQQQRRVEEE